MKSKTSLSKSSILTKSERARALEALAEARSYIEGSGEALSEETRALVDVLVEKGKDIQRAGLALVLALISDEYTPVELFRPWASSRRFQQWRDFEDVKLDVIVRHGRLCVKPSAFFKHWRSLPDEVRRKASSEGWSIANMVKKQA